MRTQASSLFHGVTFKVATGVDRETALELRRAVYSRDWPQIPLDSVVDRRDSSACHLLAVDSEGRGIGSLRIVTSEKRPFDIEESVQLDRVIPADRHPAELGRLSVDHESRALRVGSLIHLGLLKLCVDLAPSLGITDFVLAALPSLRDFYRKGLFSDAGLTYEHPTWGVVHVMRLDLVQLAATHFDHANSVVRLLLSPAPPNFQIGAAE